MIYTVFFDNGHDELREVEKINSEGLTAEEILAQIHKVISEFCEDRKYNIPYIRIWNKDAMTHFDVGSWSQFFRVSPALELK